MAVLSLGLEEVKRIWIIPKLWNCAKTAAIIWNIIDYLTEFMLKIHTVNSERK